MVRKPVIAISFGTLLIIGAVAGFVIVPEHKPQFIHEPSGCIGSFCQYVNIGASRTLYDALRITTWALLTVGVLLVTVGLINYARR